mmetsp:Transcript_9700/g.21703  ORF Transcript_9700/g.21703 Transcript_9700/m.21703 type:complete len:206 (+) Transcript_9700:96-713(+)
MQPNSRDGARGRGGGGIDPMHQAAAVHLAKEAGGYMFAAGGDAWQSVRDYLERGPEGVGWLCFLGGLLTFGTAALGIINILELVTSPLMYVINVYMMFFGLSTCVIEAPAEWVERSKRLQQALGFVHEFAKFLTTKGGRGLFYLFQGSLSLAIFGAYNLLSIVSYYMFFLGLLNVAMQYGLDPTSCFQGGSAPAPAHTDGYIRVT